MQHQGCTTLTSQKKHEGANLKHSGVRSAMAMHPDYSCPPWVVSGSANVHVALARNPLVHIN